MFRELTGKTGQKCTAIRRVLVPHALVDDVVEALRGGWPRWSSAIPGWPGRPWGRWSAPASGTRWPRRCAGLLAGAEAVIGGPDASFDIASGDPDKGAFFPPTVLVANHIRDPRLHRIEAFGPVTTVFGYDDAADAAGLAALGEGSLVASVVSHDPVFVRDDGPGHRARSTAGCWCWTAPTGKPPRRTGRCCRR